MQPVLKNTYDYFENIKGKKLVYLLVGVSGFFILIGIFAGQVISLVSNRDEEVQVVNDVSSNPENTLIEKVGKVVYSDPNIFPNDNISYKLITEKGDLIIYLSAKDDKLKVIEGARARLRGRVYKTEDGKADYLFVEQVVFK